jgi:2-amino-4-hydroxy-6-hydroxymethyldihydropteridine diphosphokinase
MPLKQAFLGLGTNLGDRDANLDRALAALEAERIHLLRKSSIYETEPQDVKDQPWFLNMVVECETRYFPLQLLSVLNRVERDLGRERGRRAILKGPRLIDIDILLFGSVCMDTPELTIPHPRMLNRRFVLEPLVEIAPDLRLPANGKPIREALLRVAAQQIRRREPSS